MWLVGRGAIHVRCDRFFPERASPIAWRRQETGAGRIVLVAFDGTPIADLLPPPSLSDWGNALAVHGTTLIASGTTFAGAFRRLYSIDRLGTVALVTTKGGATYTRTLESDGTRLIETINRDVPFGPDLGVMIHRPIGTEVAFLQHPNPAGVDLNHFGWEIAVIGTNAFAVLSEKEGANGVAYVFSGTSGAFQTIAIADTTQAARGIRAGKDWLALVAGYPPSPRSLAFIYGTDLQLRGSLASPLGELPTGDGLADSVYGLVAGPFQTNSLSSTSSVYVFDREGNALFRVVDPEPTRQGVFGWHVGASGSRILIGRRNHLAVDHDTYVFPPNSPPGPIVDVSLVVDEDESGIVSIPADPDGDTTHVAVVRPAVNGTVTTAGVYTPSTNFVGADSFILGVSDGCFETLQRVDVTVNAIDDPSPTSAKGCSCSLDEGRPSWVLALFALVAGRLIRRGVAAADESA